jgi:replication factor C subunit 2/4
MPCQRLLLGFALLRAAPHAAALLMPRRRAPHRRPHPLVVKQMLEACAVADFETANGLVEQLWGLGYCGLDIVGTFFRIAKFAELPEELKLEFIKDIGFCHMRVLDGLDTMLQLQGLVAKLCVTAASRGARPPKK